MHKPGNSPEGSVLHSCGAYWQFVREFVRHPRQIGALCPSSPVLARRMASLVPQGPGLVLELGPGGGAVTAALLRSGVAARDLLLVERCEAMARQLERRFPSVSLVRGDAAQLAGLEALRHRRVRAVVSSLPLRSLPGDEVRRILEQISRVSSRGTVLIQFSYSLRRSQAVLAEGFACEQADVVWRNVPPARVELLRYRAEMAQGLAA